MSIGFNERAAQELGPTEYLLSPWMRHPSLSMIYAPYGHMKSYFSMGLAYCISRKISFLGFSAPRERSVTYFDGELGDRDIHERCNQIQNGFRAECKRELFYIQTPQECGGAMWNLADPDGQEMYTRLARHDDVIIIDNILTCSAPLDGRDDDVKQWRRIQDWAIARKNYGQSVIFVHHAGKSGQQIGTSMRENIMDYILTIKKVPTSHEQSESFAVKFDKLRNYFGPERHGLHVKMKIQDGALTFEHEPLDDLMRKLIFQVYEELQSWNKTADYLNISIMELGRIKQKANAVEPVNYNMDDSSIW